MAVFFASFIAGAFFWVVEKLVKKQLLTIIAWYYFLFCWLLSVLNFLSHKNIYKLIPIIILIDYALEWTISKISDEYLPKNFKRPQNQNDIANFAKINSKNLKFPTSI